MLSVYEPDFITKEKSELLKWLQYGRYEFVCSYILKLYRNISTVNFLDSNFKDQLSEFRPTFDKMIREKMDLGFYFNIVYAYILISELNFNKAFLILSKIDKTQRNYLKNKDLYFLVFSDLPISIYEDKYIALRRISYLFQYPLKDYQHEVFLSKRRKSINQEYRRKRLNIPINIKSLVYRNQDLDVFFCLGFDFKNKKLFKEATLYFNKSFTEFGNIYALLMNCYIYMSNREFDKLIKCSLVGVDIAEYGYDFHYYLGYYYLYSENKPKMALRYLYYPFDLIDPLDSHCSTLKFAFSKCARPYFYIVKKLALGFPISLPWMDNAIMGKLSQSIQEIRGLIELDVKNYLKYIYVFENFEDELKIRSFLNKYLSNKRKSNLVFSLFLALLFRKFNNMSQFKNILLKLSSKSVSNLAYDANEISRNSSYVSRMTERDLFNTFSDGMYGEYDDFGGDLDDLDEMEGRG